MGFKIVERDGRQYFPDCCEVGMMRLRDGGGVRDFEGKLESVVSGVSGGLGDVEARNG